MPTKVKVDEMVIDGTTYVPKGSEKPEIVTVEKGKSIASRYTGKFVIVRTRNEGINAGEVLCADQTGVELVNARRIWYHKPKDSSLSWYEGVAVSGLSDDSKVSGTVSNKLICEDYSMTVCTEEAQKSIMEKIPNGQ